jgi:S-adenosylmethionine-diacylgycerolhomoserine-N-methlytransferase
MGAGGTHAGRLQRFYAPQAAAYDRSRERLLHGRDELLALLPIPVRAHVVDLGGGTGRNFEALGPRLDRCARAEVVDLCPALLEVARRRHAGRANVAVVEADATTYRPAAPVDCVVLSYALTMIPDWRRAIDNAVAMLKPGGVLGAVDFHVPQRAPGWAARTFWPRWFRHDGVRLSPEHLPRLRASLATLHCRERRARVPYLPGLTVPYYVFVGRTTAPW